MITKTKTQCNKQASKIYKLPQIKKYIIILCILPVQFTDIKFQQVHIYYNQYCLVPSSYYFCVSKKNIARCNTTLFLCTNMYREKETQRRVGSFPFCQRSVYKVSAFRVPMIMIIKSPKICLLFLSLSGRINTKHFSLKSMEA